MNFGRSLMEQFRRVGMESHSLRPTYPPVAVEVCSQEVVLVRLKRRRGLPSLDAAEVRPFSQPLPGPSISRPTLDGQDEVSARIREAFEASGTRPGKVSLVLPDSMAKVTLLQLPERPASRKQLSEMVRFKLRKAVPFKVEDAAIAYQLLPSEGNGGSVLVAVMLRTIVEQYERLLEGVGARPGLVSLCTPNLFNLFRQSLGGGADASTDVAFLNCAQTYFSLLIVRGERLIFYRCKSSIGEDAASVPDGMMSRELATSFSYYQEKLAGQTIRTAYVRTVSRPFDDIRVLLERLGVERVEGIDLPSFVAIPERMSLDPAVAHKIAPAVGAASGVK